MDTELNPIAVLYPTAALDRRLTKRLEAGIVRATLYGDPKVVNWPDLAALEPGEVSWPYVCPPIRALYENADNFTDRTTLRLAVIRLAQKTGLVGYLPLKAQIKAAFL